jgi:hypothetical protein
MHSVTILIPSRSTRRREEEQRGRALNKQSKSDEVKTQESKHKVVKFFSLGNVEQKEGKEKEL